MRETIPREIHDFAIHRLQILCASFLNCTVHRASCTEHTAHRMPCVLQRCVATIHHKINMHSHTYLSKNKRTNERTNVDYNKYARCMLRNVDEHKRWGCESMQEHINSTSQWMQKRTIKIHTVNTGRKYRYNSILYMWYTRRTSECMHPEHTRSQTLWIHIYFTHTQLSQSSSHSVGLTDTQTQKKICTPCVGWISAIDLFFKQCTEKQKACIIRSHSFIHSLVLTLCSLLLNAAFYLLKNDFFGSSRQIRANNNDICICILYNKTNKDNYNLYPRELEMIIKKSEGFTIALSRHLFTCWTQYIYYIRFWR